MNYSTLFTNKTKRNEVVFNKLQATISTDLENLKARLNARPPTLHMLVLMKKGGV